MTIDVHRNGRTWREVTPSNPCSICKKPDWCSRSEDGEQVVCRRVADGGEERTDASGATYFLHWLVPRPPRKSSWPEPIYSLADGKGERAEPDVLHKVYVRLLRAMSLYTAHRLDLERRGLSEPEHQRQYRTLNRHRSKVVLRLIRDHDLEHLFPRVPGFFIQDREGWRYWTLSGPHGMLIPVRDIQGRIVALLVRADTDSDYDGPKYVYLSSKSKQRGGPGPGSPVHVPLFDGDKSIVRITEGALKSDITTRLSGILTLGLPGVSAWRKAAEALKDLRAKTARVAYDADCCQNPFVAQSLRNLVRHLRREEFAVELERWDINLAKGIDDLLALGKEPEVLTGDDVADEVEAIVAATSGKGGGEAAGASGETRDQGGPGPEAPNDPHRLARLFREGLAQGGEPTLLFWQGEFFRWRAGAYRPVPDAEMRAEVTNCIKCEFDLHPPPAREGEDPAAGKRVTRGLVSDTLQALGGLSLLPSEVEPPAWLRGEEAFTAEDVLVCRNGLLHLPSLMTGSGCHLVPPTPRFFSRTALDYDFSRDARVPASWLSFLDQVWPGEPDTIGTLQEWMGYCLLPDTSQQKILMVVGPKRSGKGTIARVLRAIVGRQNACSPTLAGLGSHFGLWPLMGKSVAVISDARLSGKSDMATITERLLSISGEDAQTVDRKHREPVTTTLPTRFVVMTNELPQLSDASGALAGRMIVLRMGRSWFGREDTGLTDRLLGELPGILLWAIRGWQRLRVRGHFQQPASGEELLQDMEELASPISAFVKEHCAVEPGRQVAVKALFENWCRWCQARGWRNPTREQTFGRDLKAAFPSIGVKRPREGEDRIRVYVGIGLERPVEAPHPEG